MRSAPMGPDALTGFLLTPEGQRQAFRVSRSLPGDSAAQVALARMLSAALWSAFIVWPQLVQL